MANRFQKAAASLYSENNMDEAKAGDASTEKNNEKDSNRDNTAQSETEGNPAKKTLREKPNTAGKVSSNHAGGTAKTKGRTQAPKDHSEKPSREGPGRPKKNNEVMHTLNVQIPVPLFIEMSSYINQHYSATGEKYTYRDIIEKGIRSVIG